MIETMWKFCGNMVRGCVKRRGIYPAEMERKKWKQKEKVGGSKEIGKRDGKKGTRTDY
jgi:hypothetical protein